MSGIARGMGSVRSVRRIIVDVRIGLVAGNEMFCFFGFIVGSC